MFFKLQRFRIYGTSLLLVLALAIGQVVCYVLEKWLLPGMQVEKIETPFFLLYGPLLYFLYLTAAGLTKMTGEKLLHGIPCVILLLFYGITVTMRELHVPGHEKVLTIYYSLLAVNSLSLFVYLVIISLENRKLAMENRPLRNFIGQLSVLYVVIVVLQLVATIRFFIASWHMDIDIEDIRHALLFMVAVFSLRELLAGGREAAMVKEEQQTDDELPVAGELPRYEKSVLDEATLKAYAIQLQCYLEESKLYLDPNLSLGVLAARTGIPQHHISQLMSLFFNNSFYQFIAGYRIVYAMQLLKNKDENLTLESFAYECGFNSKSTFNRYFKEYAGCTPSEYRFNATGKGLKKQVI